MNGLKKDGAGLSALFKATRGEGSPDTNWAVPPWGAAAAHLEG